MVESAQKKGLIYTSSVRVSFVSGVMPAIA